MQFYIESTGIHFASEALWIITNHPCHSRYQCCGLTCYKNALLIWVFFITFFSILLFFALLLSRSVYLHREQTKAPVTLRRLNQIGDGAAAFRAPKGATLYGFYFCYYGIVVYEQIGYRSQSWTSSKSTIESHCIEILPGKLIGQKRDEIRWHIRFSKMSTGNFLSSTHNET